MKNIKQINAVIVMHKNELEGLLFVLLLDPLKLVTSEIDWAELFEIFKLVTLTA